MYRIPVPYFKLRSDFSILDVSKEVTHLFYPVTSFLHLVDSESRNKLKRLLNVPSPGKMEINLNTIESPTTLFTIHYNYQPKEEIIHLVCLNESASYNHIQFEFQQIKEKIQSGAWEKVIPTSMEDNTHLQQASRNAQDGISMIQTAEGALQETQAILQRMRELAVQAANDTNVTTDRNAIKAEYDQLKAEVDRIATTTKFNEKALLDGTLTGANGILQIGADKDIKLSIKIQTMKAAKLSLAGFGFATYGCANAAIAKFDTAIKTVATERSTLGAYQNRLEHTIKNLDNASENIQAAESRIRDVDMAKEMMNFTKANILNQAATAMLAQANMAPQGVLQLLQ